MRVKRRKPEIFLERKFEEQLGFANGVLTIPQWCAFFLRRLAKEPTLQFIH